MYNIIIPADSNRPTRRAHKKSRTGCRTCKERKLKCDEVKPTCVNCQKHFLDDQACVYSDAVLEKTKPPTRPLAPASQQLVSLSEGSSNVFHAFQNRNRHSRVNPSPRSLGADLLDPFETYPETRVDGVDVLMKNYLKTAVYRCFPWQPPSETNPTTTYYVPLVWGDSVLFHATLQLSAMRLVTNTRHSSEWTYNQLSVECIRLLRDRIENSDQEKGISDETISAVATLAAIEHERGNPRMMKIHLGGLNRMVRLRGGLNSIRQTNPMVANSVFWTFAAALYETPFPPLDSVLPPFFPAEHNLTSSLQPASHFQDFAPISDESRSLDLPSLGVSLSIATILTSIQHVSQLVPTSTSYPTALDHLVILTRMCTLLSHLLSLPPLYSADTRTQFSSLISESTRYAILLHVFTPWRGLPPDGTLTINYLLHRLIECLKTLPLDQNPQKNDLLLWIFAVGGVSAAGIPERSWFVGHLTVMTEEMKIGSWNEMKACVSRGIWHERLCGGPHKQLWHEILERRKSWD